jgi:hypothetical protein
MSDGWRPYERDVERELEELGARIEYPPTPDLARSVRRRLDEEEGRRGPGRRFWPSLLSPRWAVPAAALVLISFALLSPAVRETLSDLFVSGQAASSGGAAVSESGESAARRESGGTAADRPESGGGASAQAGATGCPAPSLEAEPARAAQGAKFRLHGAGFSPGCDRIRPAHDVRIDFRQDGKTWKLATVDADRSLTFGAKLRVPAGARPGWATVRATTRSGERAEERFVVLQR